jgi:hypothetical protein
MNESLFAKYVAKFFPKLQTLIEKINGKRNKQLTYLHKGADSILRATYSPDNKWEATSVNTTYVSADYVAADSPIPLKSRDKIASSTGKLPKVGMKKVLKESDINNINVMEAQDDANANKIIQKLANDSVSCSVGIDEKNEQALLEGLSNGYVAIADVDNPTQVLRLNFNYFPENTFGASVKGEVDLEDIKKIIDKADKDGNSILYIYIAESTYRALRNTRAAKELVANFKGQVYTDDTTLPTPTASVFNEAFADDNNGIQFKVIDRSIITEKNGQKKTIKPWNKDHLIFVCNEVVGSLVYGRLAEETNPVAGVTYSKVDEYKLISKFSKTDPLIEVTAGQAFVAPIIEDVDQIYMLKLEEAQEVDETAEKEDTDDAYVTVWGTKYTKASLISVMKAQGISINANATDATVINKINQLSDEDEAKLKVAAETAKA